MVILTTLLIGMLLAGGWDQHKILEVPAESCLVHQTPCQAWLPRASAPDLGKARETARRYQPSSRSLLVLPRRRRSGCGPSLPALQRPHLAERLHGWRMVHPVSRGSGELRRNRPTDPLRYARLAEDGSVNLLRAFRLQGDDDFVPVTELAGLPRRHSAVIA